MKSMKLMKLMTWIAVMAMIILLTACTSAEKEISGEAAETIPEFTLFDKQTKNVMSEDETVQISVPENWITREVPLNGNNRLVVHNDQASMILNIIQEHHEDVNEDMDLEKWAEEFYAEIGEVTILEERVPQIDGVAAREKFIKFVQNNTNQFWMQTFLEKDGAFYLISIAISESSYSSNKEELQKMTETFKVLKPAEKEVFDSTNSQTMFNDDQSLQITVPLNWREARTDINQIGEFILKNDRKAEFLLMREFASGKTEEITVQEVVDGRFENYKQFYQGEIIGSRELLIDGRPAYQLEGRCEYKGEKHGLLITALQKDNAYYVMMISSPIEDFLVYEREYKRVLESLHVLKKVEEQNKSHGMENEQPKVFDNKLASMKIELTEGWKKIDIDQDAQLQAIHPGDNTWFYAYGEKVSEDDGLTVEDLFEFYSSDSGLENPRWMKPEPIKIQAYDAIYFKGTGTSEGTKATIIGAITLSSSQYTFLIFAGKQDVMEDNEAWFKKALTTYSERLW
ncbi:hypothetical protein [Paenibacillus woosongensis]|uniref:DUF1795 domain-containing protein n=1 Tax=Paenibacillus woosongensis TaxID=307580 RepID=A0A7X2Z1M9_9BACL|nr:hypothetical protein [Paenibacillus woosongensis]MUG45858.1 hypothetical protein [Paenibacillus woosongensis]